MHLFRSIDTVLLLALPLTLVTTAPAVGQQNRHAVTAAAGAGTGAFATPPATASFAPERYRQAAPEALDQMRGGSDTVANPVNNIASDTQLRGTTANNTATDIVTGNNMIQSSFSNAAGIPVVIQNSGANVLIQNATVVNLQFK